MRAFDVATRHSIFTFAATGLCVTQSAVSHQRRHLEALWGVMLFQGNNPATAPRRCRARARGVRIPQQTGEHAEPLTPKKMVACVLIATGMVIMS
ncbi:LysR family transcriptional regulator [Pantoea sp. KPR_PJ]